MLDAGNGRNDRVARLYAPNHVGGEMLEITSTNPLVYATPGNGVVIANVGPTADGITLLLSNLTEHCEYRIEETQTLGQPWSNAASFEASAPQAAWSNRVEQSRRSYRAVGLPQQEP